MEKLKCDMCGSNDIVKEDGLFVCQNCGMKYSLEEARKMFNKVEVVGTVNVTVDSKPKANDYLILAKRSVVLKKWKDTYDYAAKALEADPNSVEATLIKAKAAYVKSYEESAGLYRIALELSENDIEKTVSIIKDDMCELLSRSIQESENDTNYSESVRCKVLSEEISIYGTLIKEVKGKYNFDIGEKALADCINGANQFNRKALACIISKNKRSLYYDKIDIYRFHDGLLEVMNLSRTVLTFTNDLSAASEAQSICKSAYLEAEQVCHLCDVMLDGSHHYLTLEGDEKKKIEKSLKEVEELYQYIVNKRNEDSKKSGKPPIIVFGKDVSSYSIDEFKQFLLENEKNFEHKQREKVEEIEKERWSGVLPPSGRLPGYIVPTALFLVPGFLVFLGGLACILDGFTSAPLLLGIGGILILIGIIFLIRMITGINKFKARNAALDRKNQFERNKQKRIKEANDRIEINMRAYRVNPLEFYQDVVEKLKNN